MLKKTIAFIVILALIPAVIALGVVLFRDRRFNIISIAVALLACVPFFLFFEKKQTKARELVVIAVMVALSAVGRLIFIGIPGFKPLAAIVIITGLAFGAEAGFLTGSLSAVLSNIFFGQGPWTPFQMFVWGILGFAAGLFYRRQAAKTWPALIVWGIASGAAFSLLMDIWTVFSLDGGWNWARYWTALIAGLPYTAIYMGSNVLFLLLLFKPISKKLERVKVKYMLFDYGETRGKE